MKTHWKKLNNPDYIGAYELLGVTDELIVKIKEVKKVDVKGMDGKTEQCTVAYLYEQKPMILNSTNCKTITRIYDTPFIEEWKDIEIILIVKKVKAFGDVVDALRIKDIKPRLPDLLPDTTLWSEAKKALSNGFTIAQIKKKYTLSNNNEKLLTDEG
jgi:hypothetical protein